MTQPNQPSTDRAAALKVSEIFDSVQGEGPSAGAPCTFLRLAGCNLRCSWCDTPYTWDWSRYSPKQEITTHTLESLITRLSGSPRVVITGGEPLLQQARLATLVSALPRGLALEVETNGTIGPAAELCERVNQWNVSPKLSHAGESAERALVEPALLRLRETGRAWLKLVVASAADADEALALVARLAWPKERVMLMPLAATRLELARVGPQVNALAEQHGVGFSPRLHVERWDGKRGV